MAHRNLDPDGDVDLIVAWPIQRVAAEILGISESALSRRTDLDFEQAGARERHYRPAAVLEAGAFYKRRSLNAIAAKLIAYAREHGSVKHVDRVRSEVDDFFAQRQAIPIDREKFLKEARRALPRRLYREVERAFDQGVIEEPELESAEVDFGLPSVKAS